VKPARRPHGLSACFGPAGRAAAARVADPAPGAPRELPLELATRCQRAHL